MDNPIWDLQQLRNLFRRWRRFLFWNVTIVTVGALVVSLFLKPWYSATTTLLPPQEDESGFNVTTMLRGLTIPGVRIPTQASPAEVYVAILHSRTLMTEIIQHFHLMDVYDKKKMEDAVQELKQHFAAEISEDGLISLHVEDHDRKRAADMANEMIVLLDDINRNTRSTRGKRARVFVQERLQDTQRELSAAEDSLRRYQQRTKSLLLPTEESGAADVSARLLAERIDLQMQLGLASSYATQDNPEVARLRMRQDELDRQIAKLPGLGMGAARLYRDVKVQEQVFSILMAQLEEAKIEEAKDVPTVEVLDQAVPPERKSRPKRIVIVGLAFAASIVLGAGYVLLADYWKRVGTRG
jgi:uncharacterized protein involved in exopolysaccharide biosynthesis